MIVERRGSAVVAKSDSLTMAFQVGHGCSHFPRLAHMAGERLRYPNDADSTFIG